MISLLLAATVLATPHRFVVAVGHNGPPDASRPTLRFADDDAARFYELVAPGAAEAVLLTTFDAESQPLYGGLVAQSRPPTLGDVEATLARFRKKIEALEAQGERTELFFFYAGHGDVADGEGYVQLADGRLTRGRFRRAVVDEARADATHVFIDACKSYFMVAGRGPGGRREAWARPFVGQADAPSVGFVVSTSNDAESHEWAAIAGGIVSHEVRSALAGAADANADGRVDYAELAAFVAAANESLEASRYQPRVHVRPPPQDRQAAVLATTLPGRTRLRLPPALAGRVSVTDERGLRYADAHKQAGAPFELGLVGPRRYEVRVGTATYRVDAAGAPVDLASLTPEASPQLAARGEAHRAFEQLFDHPFDADLVRGYRLGGEAVGEVQAPDLPDHSGRWWLVGGALGVTAGAALAVWAADEWATGAGAAQVDRPGHEARAHALGWSAGGALLLGLGALGVGVWVWE